MARQRFTLVVSVFKAVIGDARSVLKNYVDNIEPYLKDPVAFPKVQVGERLFGSVLLLTLICVY
jgi:hypothetical protein